MREGGRALSRVPRRAAHWPDDARGRCHAITRPGCRARPRAPTVNGSHRAVRARRPTSGASWLVTSCAGWEATSTWARRGAAPAVIGSVRGSFQPSIVAFIRGGGRIDDRCPERNTGRGARSPHPGTAPRVGRPWRQGGAVQGRDRGASFEVIHAALYAAEDLANRTPAIIALAGPHWTRGRELGSSDPRGAKCDQPGHEGKPAHNCSYCIADRKARNDDDDMTPTAPVVDTDRIDTNAIGARNARRALEAALEARRNA